MDRILLVDDDVLILQALSRILQSEGYEVVTHSDPTKAARETGFALVITDFMMPQMNGIELLAMLKQSNPRSMRLMLTAAGDFKTASDAVNRGEVYRLLSKPWTLPDLISSVKQALAHLHLTVQNEQLRTELQVKNDALVSVNHD